MGWTQIYDPMQNIWLSAIIAVIPIFFFFLGLTVLKMKAYMAAGLTVILSVIVAVAFYKMPVNMVIGAAGYGIIYALWPIAYIIIGALFLYKLSVKSGQFDVIRQSIVSITDDPRLQMLLVAFSFNAFLEGAAGFGAPIAITAALLVGLGFNPLKAAALCLIANTASGAFGAMGIPVIVAGQVSGIEAKEIAKFLGYSLPCISFFVPFLLVMIMDGFKGVREVWKPTFVTAATYAIAQYLTITFIGPELPNIIASIVSLVSLAFYIKVTNKKDAAVEEKLTVRQVLKAWSPFIALTFLVTTWSLNFFKGLFAPGGLFEKTNLMIEIPGLHNQVIKATPLVPEPTPYAAVLKLDVIAATGSAIALSGIIAMLILRMDLKTGKDTLMETIEELSKPIFTIMMVLAFAFVANYSGQSSTLGLALANTAHIFPFLSPVLGWIGVFLTGSVVSNNALFGSLQTTTASQIQVLPLILVAANTAGGVMAKMLSPQSIAVATGAVGLVGKEADLFRFTLKYSIGFLILAGIITFVQALLL
ncbi:lactate permease LctP family transporter [Bacillus songklensis]|uniref:L-lactate permease n=1 Tax=Bacillus songklensis TaxID=1069116 RepID=A0ABV8B5E9_9BACI